MIDFFLRRWVSDHQNTQDPAVRQRYGTLSGVVGIVLNLLLFAGKFLAGALTASIAVIEGGAMTKDLAGLWEGEIPAVAVTSRQFLEAIRVELERRL